VKSAGRDYGPIPPRQWLLGTTFCVGFLSALIGTGGVGKTALRLLQLIAVALGRGDLVGEHVFKRTKVLLVCLEDDDELRRRIRAACLHHGIVQSDLDGWLYYWTPHDLRLIEVEGRGREIVPGALGDALRGILKQLSIGLVSIDPFVKSHSAEENDNSAIDKAATVFLQVGHECGAAVDYLHHQRKGIAIAGDADSSRGASSLVNASRLVKTANRMTQAEAEKFGLSERERKLTIRVDDGKINIGAPDEQAVWFRLVGVEIGNPTETYPRGDNVQTVERWYPPEAFEDLPKSQIAEIFARLRQGPGEGERYLTDPRANGDWAGSAIVELAGKTTGQAKEILRTWLKNEVLIKGEFVSPRRRQPRTCITINEVKAAEVLGSLYRPPGSNGHHFEQAEDP
jgi:hypothetical protein